MEIFNLEYKFNLRALHRLQKADDEKKLHLKNRTDNFTQDVFSNLQNNLELSIFFLYSCQNDYKDYEKYRDLMLEQDARTEKNIIAKATAIFRMFTDKSSFLQALQIEVERRANINKTLKSYT